MRFTLSLPFPETLLRRAERVNRICPTGFLSIFPESIIVVNALRPENALDILSALWSELSLAFGMPPIDSTPLSQIRLMFRAAS